MEGFGSAWVGNTQMEAPIKTRRRPGTCFPDNAYETASGTLEKTTPLSRLGQRRHLHPVSIFSKGFRAKHSARQHCHSPACVECAAASRFVMVPRYANQIFHKTFVLFTSIKSQVCNRLVPDIAWLYATKYLDCERVSARTKCRGADITAPIRLLDTIGGLIRCGGR
jgi:hypothetical protein